MARRRRRRSTARKRRQGPGHNEMNRANPESRQRQKMLRAGDSDVFRYDIEDILNEAETEPERVNSLSQAIVTRATRLGIPEAKMYVVEKSDDGTINTATKEKLARLLDRYSTYR